MNTCVSNEGEIEFEKGFNFSSAQGCYVRDMDVIGGLVGYVVPNPKTKQVVVVQVNFSADTSTVESASNIIKNIVSTFKFTK